MLADNFKLLFTRDLLRLKRELELYTNEEHIWLIDKDILNCAGNLTLHLVGNLNTYIGSALGGIEYVRNRPEEFSLKNVPRNELLYKIDGTNVLINQAFSNLTDDQIMAAYPQEFQEQTLSTHHVLTHLAMHLSYHLGQVNYHRRLLDN
jgi:hypothetical protein